MKTNGAVSTYLDELMHETMTKIMLLLNLILGVIVLCNSDSKTG